MYFEKYIIYNLLLIFNIFLKNFFLNFRFPLSKKRHNKEKLEKNFNHLEANVKYIKKLQRYVSLMFYNNLRSIEEMKLNSLLRYIAEHSIIYRFVLNDINRIISVQLSR